MVITGSNKIYEKILQNINIVPKQVITAKVNEINKSASR